MKKRMALPALLLVIAGILMLGCDNGTSSSDSITWSIAQKGGTSGTADSTHLVITFNKQVTGLTAADITFNNDVIAAKAGEPVAGSGNNSWELPITVLEEGAIEVSITKSDVATGAKSVAVYKDTRIVTFTLSQNGGVDGAADTESITFSFNKAVEALAAADITVTPAGRITISEPTAGTGNTWVLPITVQAPGEVSISIAKAGFDPDPRTVTVYKAGVAAPASYTVVADGGAGTATSTKLTFSFSKVITGLTAAMITLTDDTGAAVKGDAVTVTDNAQVWELPITVSAAGNITVAIAHADIDDVVKDVAVYKVITYTVTQIGGDSEVDGDGHETATADTTALEFVFSEAVVLDADDITLTPATRITAGALTGTGTTWTLAVTTLSSGNIQVAVALEGVETAEKTEKVYLQGSEILNGWSAVADGNAGTQSSTKITFTFDEEIATLTAAEIVFTSSTVFKGSVTKTSGTVWVLNLSSVTAAANLSIAINKAGVETDAQVVAVHYRPPSFEDDYNVSILTTDGSDASGKGNITGTDLTAINNANYGSFLRLTVSQDGTGSYPGGAIGNVTDGAGQIEGGLNLGFSYPGTGNTIDLPLSEVWRYIRGEGFLYINAWDGLIIEQIQLYAKKVADTPPDLGAGVIAVITITDNAVGYLDVLDILDADDDAYLKIYTNKDAGGVASLYIDWSVASISIQGGEYFVVYVSELKAIGLGTTHTALFFNTWDGTEILRVELKEPHAADYVLNLTTEVDATYNTVDFTGGNDFFKITFNLPGSFDITKYAGFTVRGESYISDGAGGYTLFTNAHQDYNWGWGEGYVRLVQDINGDIEGGTNVILDMDNINQTSVNAALPTGLSQTPGGIVVFNNKFTGGTSGEDIFFARIVITEISFTAAR